MALKILINGGNGYIGSRLSSQLRAWGYDIIVADLGLFQLNPKDTQTYNFNQLPASFIQSFDIVIHLAAHSCVLACELNPEQSFVNNCLDFFHLVGKINPNQKLIYASSGSVYGCSGDRLAAEDDVLTEAINHYDKQKQLIDLYMLPCLFKWYGLRFGTVCGYSENPRNELMINSMVASALQNNRVDVTSADLFRAVLGLTDLCRAVKSIIDSDGESGYYNLASFNMKIHNIGKVISDKFNTNFSSLLSGSSSYSFCLDTTKFCKEFNFIFEDTIDSIAEAAAKNDFSRVRNWNIKL